MPGWGEIRQAASGVPGAGLIRPPEEVMRHQSAYVSACKYEFGVCRQAINPFIDPFVNIMYASIPQCFKILRSVRSVISVC